MTEDIGLNHAGEQTERGHHNSEEKRRDGKQDADDHDPAHHVSKQTNRQSASVRESSLMMLNGSMMSRGFRIGLQVAAESLLADAEERHSDEYA